MKRALLLIAVLVACSKHEDAHAPLNDQKAISAHENAHAIAKPPRTKPAQLTKVTIKALGMYCEETCPLKVRTALASVPAVYELGFDVSTESIFVSYDATLGTPKDVTKPMLVAIKGAGFDPWLAKEAWPDDADVAVVP
ncbi:MAG: heavy-metal-associated domain-containing protein [Kofleriaceae bacterium]